jgi:23S rRNA (cytidine1920-2'-O)/16S rRNA (cytidine1409-2'-O)-methyltransferase
LDVLLVERGLAETREKAQALILAGAVAVEGKKSEKAGAAIASDARIVVLGPKSRYVGRGGDKLQGALDELLWNVGGWVALDIGSSTGGFVDCLLQRGAQRVIAVDAGTGQLDWHLRNDARVRLLERTNARYLRWEQIGERADLITMDVSFISATRILPAVIAFARPGTKLLVLVKPQFEVGKGKVGKGGIVRDAKLHREAVEQVRACAAQLGFENLRNFPCVIRGTEGNQEFFLAGEYAGASEGRN